MPSFDSAWFGRNGLDRQVVIVIALALIAVAALLIAGSAFVRDQRQRARLSGDEPLFTTTPIPMAGDERALMRESSPHDAFSGLRIPRWVQVGSLLAALAITWNVAERVAPNSAMSITAKKATPAAAATSDLSEASPENLDLASREQPTFAFQARDWVTRREGGCEGQLVVTRGEASAWTLTARVHDDEGQLIDTAHTRVSALRVGDVVQFNFPRADCDRIGAWDVRGDRRAR